jgi:glycosyltransferase involved in cell wall biosynthesis
MRILIVGFIESIHLARAVDLLRGSGWDVHLFPSHLCAWPHPELRDVTVHVDSSVKLAETHPSVRVERLKHPLIEADAPMQSDPPPIGWRQRAKLLAELIEEIEPDLLHSHELQHAGYLTYDARALCTTSALPPWLISNWGSDLNWFGRHPRHVERIKAVLRSCDVYACDCHRDAGLARAFGFRGPILPNLPVPGGFDLQHLASLRQPGPTSRRRTIALKGTLFTFGRAGVALNALERNADLLKGYRLALYLASEEIVERAQELCVRSGAELEVLSTERTDERPYDELLAMHGAARVSIALNASDGTSVSFLEAMAMGSLPIHSSTGCVAEWARPGVGALFVDPTDEVAVQSAVRRALTDDALVDGAAEVNAQTAAAHLDRRVIRTRMLDAYERVVAWSMDRRVTQAA